MDYSLVFPRSGQFVFGIVRRDALVVDNTPGVSNKCSFRAVNWIRHPVFEISLGAEAQAKVFDGFGSKSAPLQIWMLGVEPLEFKIKGSVYDSIRFSFR